MNNVSINQMPYLVENTLGLWTCFAQTLILRSLGQAFSKPSVYRDLWTCFAQTLDVEVYKQALPKPTVYRGLWTSFVQNPQSIEVYEQALHKPS
jgi:hypothetical protein